jgi:hypothetical protein
MFIDLVEQLSAYTTNPDYLTYVTRFVDGLQDDIRAVLLVQRPADLDVACTLALLQEEALEPHGRKDVKRTDLPTFTKQPPARGAVLPPPHPRQQAAGIPSAPCADDKRPPDDRRQPPRRASVDDKLQSLRSYRKACGLCMRCGEKWHQGHKCAPALQLHALQQIWALCEDIFSKDQLSEHAASPESEQAFMLLSAATTSTAVHPRTLLFDGIIQGKAVKILIDSGSTHSFLDCQSAQSLDGVKPMQCTASVKVANGSSVACASHIPCAEWSIQGYSFHSTLKIILIGTYDMIVVRRVKGLLGLSPLGLISRLLRD